MNAKESIKNKLERSISGTGCVILKWVSPKNGMIRATLQIALKEKKSTAEIDITKEICELGNLEYENGLMKTNWIFGKDAENLKREVSSILSIAGFDFSIKVKETILSY